MTATREKGRSTAPQAGDGAPSATILNVMGCRSIQYGSFEDYLVVVSEACARKGLRCAFVYPEEPVEPRFRTELERAGADLLVVPGTESPTRAGALALWREMRRRKPAIVHAHFGRVGYLSAVLGRLAGAPVVLLSKHQTSWPYITRKTAATYSALSLGVTGVLAGAGPVFEEFDALGIPARKRLLVPFPGVDTDRYQPGGNARSAMRESLGVTDGQPLLIAVSHLKEQKGVRYLIDAMRGLSERHPEARLLIVGDGLIRSELEAQAQASGIGERIRFLGHRSDVAELLEAADLFVCPTLCEGGCAGSLEAMAAGKPIVTTPLGLARDLVPAGDCGRVARSADADSLASAISELLDRPHDLPQMGRRSREMVVRHADIAQVAEQLADVYEACILQRKAVGSLDVVAAPPPSRQPTL